MREVGGHRCQGGLDRGHQVARRGSGHAVLFGFRPQYRGQSMATFPLLWNALLGRFDR